MRQSLFVSLLFVLLGSTFAFTSNPTTFTRKSFSLYAGDADKEGGAAIAKPKVGVKVDQVTKQKSKSVSRQKSKTSDPISRRDEKFEDAPMFKVMLIGDEDYDQAHVIERMCEVLDDMDENQAASVFKSAQQGGQAMCGKYPLEHAEMFKELLIRSDPMIYSDVVEENK
jgi:ATP-dependent Clp protease adapter protein ClpS|eukprot:855925_1